MIYVIGDVHGRIDHLDALLDVVINEYRMQKEDTLLFLGDYIDRGEDSKGVVQRVIDLKAQWPNVVTLRGNHEQMILDSASEGAPKFIEEHGYCHFGDETDLWLYNGGLETMDSYGLVHTEDYSKWVEAVPQSHWDFFKDTVIEHNPDGSRFRFVHAGLLPSHGWWENEVEDRNPCLWIREAFLNSDEDFGKIVVFGHTPQRRPPFPLVHPNKIGMDTGAAYGYRLSLGVFDPKDATKFRLRQAEYLDGEVQVLDEVLVSIPQRGQAS